MTPVRDSHAALQSRVAWLKAMGISLVVLHHFSRSLWFAEGVEPPPINQWQFLGRGEPLHRLPYEPMFSQPWLALAQWGYLGVFLFVVASALGHGAKFAYTERVAWWPFIRGKLRKTWLPSVISVVVFALMSWRSVNWWVAARRAVGIGYFVPEEFFAINSPLWFLFFIFQFYFLLPWLHQALLRWGDALVLAAVPLSLFCRWGLSQQAVIHWHPYLAHACVFSWLGVLLAGMHMGRALSRGEMLGARKAAGVSMPFVFAAASLLVLFCIAQSRAQWHFISESALGLAILAALRATWGAAMPLPTFVAMLANFSFQFYLYHRPLVTAFLSRWNSRIGLSEIGVIGAAAIVIVVTVTAALLRYRWVTGELAIGASRARNR